MPKPERSSESSTWTYFIPTIKTTDGVIVNKATTHDEAGLYKIDGNVMTLQYTYHHTYATGASSGTANKAYCIALPDGYEIDTNYITIATDISTEPTIDQWTYQNCTCLGLVQVAELTSSSINAHTIGISATCLGVYVVSLMLTDTASNDQRLVGNGHFDFNVDNKRIQINATIPITRVA